MPQRPTLHGKNGFADPKIKLDADLKIILDHQNNYVGRSSWLLECQKNLLQYCSLCSA